MRAPPRQARRGFTLLVVMVVMFLLGTVLLVTLRGTGSQIRASAIQRDRNLVQASAEHGLTLAMNWLATCDGDSVLDIDELGAATASHDIFNNWAAATRLVPPANYPPNGDHQGAFEVQVGAARGQLTRPPAGEDVRTSYGQIVEVQINVRSAPAANARPVAEQRFEVGVRIPRTYSHSNP